MKLFNDSKEDFLTYIEQPLLNKDVELEISFGSQPSKNPVTKDIFLSLIENCNGNYQLFEESTNLDIRCEYRNNISNIRCTIDGLDSIKKYCNTNSLEGIEEDTTFVQKQYYKNTKDTSKKYLSLKDYDYNVRLNVKRERELDRSNRFVTSFLSNFDDKKKYYRYKKRKSYLTDDKLFRIDLTVVKSTKYFKGRYDFQKTFRKANILKNKEEYEVEIEYVGWKKEVGNEEIDRLYNHFNETYITEPGKEIRGNIYDPLNLGIPLFENEKPFVNEETNYEFDSPRYTDTTHVEDSEELKKYEDLIGKYVKIKEKYFVENDIDPVLFSSLKEYYKKGIYLVL